MCDLLLFYCHERLRHTVLGVHKEFHFVPSCGYFGLFPYGLTVLGGNDLSCLGITVLKDGAGEGAMEIGDGVRVLWGKVGFHVQKHSVMDVKTVALLLRRHLHGGGIHLARHHVSEDHPL